MFRWSSIHWKHPKVGSYEIIALTIIALAVILRIVLLALSMPETNSDEGTIGLEAMHIAFRGEHPIFLYGQDYMGVLEAYIAAFFFHLFGVSVFTLRIGMISMFTFFLISMYFLTNLLYTKKLALLTLALLSFGAASDVLIQELRTVGGAIETLLFGSLVLLLASWLALTSRQTLTPRTHRWRLVAFGCWGLVIGSAPFIIYNLGVPPEHNTIIATLSIQRSTNLASQYSQHLLIKQIIGTTLWG